VSDARANASVTTSCRHDDPRLVWGSVSRVASSRSRNARAKRYDLRTHRALQWKLYGIVLRARAFV